MQAAFPQATVLRPSVLFGSDDNFVNMFAGLTALPVLPVFAPAAKLQPLFVDDAAEAVGNALARVDPACEQASADLGASPAATFFHITWPLTLPGVVSGAIIVFTLAVSAYVTPALLSGGRISVLSMLIFQQYSSVFDFHYGGALSMVLLVFTLILVALANRAATLPGAAR